MAVDVTTVVRFVPVILDPAARAARIARYSCARCKHYAPRGCGIGAYDGCRANAPIGYRPRYFEEMRLHRKEEAGKAS